MVWGVCVCVSVCVCACVCVCVCLTSGMRENVSGSVHVSGMTINRKVIFVIVCAAIYNLSGTRASG